MKRIIYIIPFLFLFNFSHAQFKNFTINKDTKKVEVTKMYADIITLEIFHEDNNKVNSQEVSKESFTGLESFLIGTVAKLPDYISQFLKARKKKYTSTYSAKNTLDFSSSNDCLPVLLLKRKFFTSKDTSAIEALSLTLSPQLVQNDTYLVFKPKELSVNFSKARIKKKAPFINLLVEITATYIKKEDTSSIEKIETKSSAIIIPVDMRETNQNLKILNGKTSDVFLPNDIVEISISITEINPYKLKLEALESFLNDNKDDLSGLFGELSKLLKKE